MNTKAIQPLLPFPCIVGRSRSIFRLPQKEVEVTIPARAANLLIRQADGTHSMEEIVTALSRHWHRGSVQQFLSVLFAQGVLIDSRNISGMTWEYIRNPSPWYHNLTEDGVGRLVLETSLQRSRRAVAYTLRTKKTDQDLLNRSSTREFGNRSVGERAISAILNASYGVLSSQLEILGSTVHRRTVPSAGGLYPLLLHLVLFKDAGKIKAGVYRVCLNEINQVTLHRLHQETDDARSCFVDRSTVRHAAGYLVLSGVFPRSTSKYGNRGILYTVLEAGHAAQNALRAAQKESVATCEVGGFFETRLHKLLKLPAGTEPLTTILFGSHPLSSESETAIPIGDTFVARCETVPQRTRAGSFSLPFTMVFAEVNNGQDGWWTCGRSNDPDIAKRKALAEAVEWTACGRVNPAQLIQTSYRVLGDTAIDPRTMAQYLSWQFNARTGLVPFHPQRTHEWTTATNTRNGNEKQVLADFVYFPYRPQKNKRYAYATSSGCAAHSSIETAIQNALLELIEREAFLVTWLNQIAPPVITKASVSRSMQRRIRNLEDIGCEVHLTDLTTDLTPVPLVTVYSRTLSFLTCAAASSFNPEEALDKALMEAEAGVFCRLRDGPKKTSIAPKELSDPDDHATLYEDPAAIRRALFLRGDKRHIRTLRDLARQARQSVPNHLQDALRAQNLTPYIVTLEQAPHGLQNGPVTVVRAIVPGMIPMVFGTDLVPLKMPRIQKLSNLKYGVVKPYSELNRFPHPFN